MVSDSSDSMRARMMRTAEWVTLAMRIYGLYSVASSRCVCVVVAIAGQEGAKGGKWAYLDIGNIAWTLDPNSPLGQKDKSTDAFAVQQGIFFSGVREFLTRSTPRTPFV